MYLYSYIMVIIMKSGREMPPHFEKWGFAPLPPYSGVCDLRCGQKSDLVSCLETDLDSTSDFDEADVKLIDGARWFIH